ncbi:MAG TPA: hypothetical protein VMV74_11940 [Bacteroidales bacterium]|nr:hypothetical protein [Bacteroidales bacterium]
MERRKLIRNAAGFGLAGLIGNKMNAYATVPSSGVRSETSWMDGSQVDDWHSELTQRIAVLDERGGGTLELGDGVYEISKPLNLLSSVSLVMTPNAVIKAMSGFEGDAVLIKGAGRSSTFSGTGGWIRGGVIDGSKLPITGIRVEKIARLEIADLVVKNALHKGIHLLKGGYERNLTRVRCDVDGRTPYAPGSIGIHYEGGDNKVFLAHVLGYETGVRSDLWSNWFTLVHVWNSSAQGPMYYCFYCNGDNNTYNQCYADSPTTAGFYVTKAHQSFIQNRIYHSRWAKDISGAGFLITPEGKHGNYIGNVLFADEGHRLAKAFDGDLVGATILGSSSWRVMGGLENRISSGEELTHPELGSIQHPALHLGGTGFRLTQQTTFPLPEQGDLGEVRWVDDGKTSALLVKTTIGWKKAPLL